jgi:carboxylesterase type B
VVRPVGVPSITGLPVLAWINGGGFQEGGSADQRYNMSFIVQESVKMGKPLIAASFNYRLGGSGFLPGTSVHKSRAANLGLHDQRMALRWIQENIAAFGGDASRVTVQGESAGAFSIGVHYLTNEEQDEEFFHAAIAESGGPVLGAPLTASDEQDVMYERILTDIGCLAMKDDLECLRSQDASKLNQAFARTSGSYVPILDADLVTGYTSVALREGRFSNRPLLIGTCYNEASSIIVASCFAANTSADFQDYVAGSWKGISSTTINGIVDEYVNKMSEEELKKSLGTIRQSPGPQYGSLFGNLAMYQGDIIFDATRRYTTEVWGQYRVPVYSYRFSVVPNGIDSEILGVPHFQEIPFAFRNFDGVGHEVNRLASASFKPRQKYLQVSNLMSRMWISFVNEHSPNGHDGKSLL